MAYSPVSCIGHHPSANDISMSVFSLLSPGKWILITLGFATYVQSGTEAAACSIFQEAGVGGCARYGSVACSSVARSQQYEVL